MKKFILLFSFLAFAVFSMAQITIDQSDLVGIGEQVIQARDTVPAGINGGPGGTSQTWNFAGLANHTTDTLNFTNPNWTPYSADFPGANLAAQFGTQDFYVFLNNSSGGLFMDGFAGDLFGTGTGIAMDNVPDETLAEFPLNYTDNWTSNYTQDITIDGSGMGVDSLRRKLVGQKDVVTDAWGSLTTPMGTFDVLRLDEYKIETDSVWIYNSGPLPGWTLVDNNVDTSYNYSFWSDDPSTGFPLVEMRYDPATGDAWEVSWLLAAPTPSGIVENAPSELLVYPNPASNYLTFEHLPINAYRVEIIDLTGRTLIASYTSNPMLQVDLQALSVGTYFYVIRDKQNLVLQSGKLKVTR